MPCCAVWELLTASTAFKGVHAGTVIQRVVLGGARSVVLGGGWLLAADLLAFLGWVCLLLDSVSCSERLAELFRIHTLHIGPTL